MAVCQAFTGSGGWPTTIIMTPEQKPFFAGTYFPKTVKYGQVGLVNLLQAIGEVWQTDRAKLLESAEEIITYLDKRATVKGNETRNGSAKAELDEKLIDKAVTQYRRMFDETYGGFGRAPKFPTPHNLLFLMRYYEKSKDEKALKMVEKTLYDNALLILAYCKAYQITKNGIYRDVAERTAAYILREMTTPEDGFYSAQDADSEGVEGKYYLFEPAEIMELLGEKEGKEFN